MTPEQWASIERIYHDARTRPPDDRSAFLIAACGDDADLLREVSTLLAHDATNATFLETPAVEIAANTFVTDARAESGAPPAPDDVFGQYRLIERIGHGGMGEVFLAHDDRLVRRVALKFLPPDVANDASARALLMREARAASALNHPGIVTIHAIEEAGARTFIVMEHVDGVTLAERLAQGPVPLAQVLQIGSDVARALSAAHEAGLIHRDIKPANIMLTPAGRAKILDFGIALSAVSGDLTGSGVLGTVSYMSPEQARGERLDARTDVFSLGAVLYEASTGVRPFACADLESLLGAMSASAPRRPSEIVSSLPQGFDRLILAALDVRRENRPPTSLALAADLEALADAPRRATLVRRRRLAAAAIAGIVATAAGVVWWQQAGIDRRTQAANALVRAEELAASGAYREAHALALEVRRVLPDEARLAELWPIVTDVITVRSDPDGAVVYATNAASMDESGGRERVRLGTTPIEAVVVPRGNYLVEVEKTGFATARRVVSSALARVENSVWQPAVPGRRVALREVEPGRPVLLLDVPAPITISMRLIPIERQHAGMVFVPGGDYELVGARRPSRERVTLDDYFIDRFEVSNRDYLPFVEAGAAAPRAWPNGRPSQDQLDHPVTGVTWNEAAAYAAFRGASLPTVFQWQKAARNGAVARAIGYVMPWGLVADADTIRGRANFLGAGTVPVDRFPFGASPYGAEQMAGNVSEWGLNRRGELRTILGGSFQDPPYLFSWIGAFPAAFASPAIGFRTVRLAGPSTGDQGAGDFAESAERPREEPVAAAAYAALLSHYRYDDTPLDARVEAIQDAPDWTREKISFASPQGDRALAYLYLPKRGAGPRSVLHYMPSDAVQYGLQVPDEVEVLMAPFIRDGRAVFAVVGVGFSERRFPPGFSPPARASVAYRALAVARTIDLRRGIEYLESRPEIDMARLAAFATSSYSNELIVLAVESRYRAIVLLSAGLPLTEGTAAAEANAINFLPRITAPTLVMAGRYDETLSLATEVEPLYQLLRAPKHFEVIDGGHIPPLALWLPVARTWLEKAIGR
jgi:hypothetical protein